MSSTLHSFVLIGVMVVITATTRFLPFILFKNSEKTPKVLKYLGKVLPGAIMGMLVIYCFKDVNVIAYPYILPEIIATAFIVALYLWRKNVMLSIGLGVILYMFLVQVVFV